MNENFELFFNELALTNFSMLKFHIHNKKNIWEKIESIWNKFFPLFNVSNNKEIKNKKDLIKDFGLKFGALDKKLKYKIILKNYQLINFLNNNDIQDFLKNTNDDLKFYCLTFSNNYKKGRINLKDIEIYGDWQFTGKLLIKENLKFKNDASKNELIKKVLLGADNIKYSFNENLFSFDEFILFLKSNNIDPFQLIKECIEKADLMTLLQITTNIQKSKWSRNIQKEKFDEIKKIIAAKFPILFEKEGKQIEIKIPSKKEELIKVFPKISPYEFFRIYLLFEPWKFDHFGHTTTDIKFDESELPISFINSFAPLFSISYNGLINYKKWLKTNSKPILLYSLFENTQLNYFIEKYINNIDDTFLSSFISINAIASALKILYPQYKNKFELRDFWECIKMVIEDFSKNIQYILKILFAPAENFYNFRNKIMHFDENIKKFPFLSLAAMNVAFEMFLIQAKKENSKK